MEIGIKSLIENKKILKNFVLNYSNLWKKYFLNVNSFKKKNECLTV